MKSIIKLLLYTLIVYLLIKFVVELVGQLFGAVLHLTSNIHLGFIIIPLVIFGFLMLIYYEKLAESDHPLLKKLAKVASYLKSDVAPKIKQSSIKSWQFINSFIEHIEGDLTTTVKDLKMKQEKLKEHLKNLEQLRSDMDLKQQEVDTLKQQIDALQQHSSQKEMAHLRNELDVKLSELLDRQKDYIRLEEKIKVHQANIQQLIQEKAQLELERTYLRNKYENTQHILKQNKEKLAKLQNEIQQLKAQEQDLKDRHELASQHEIDLFQRNLQQLSNEIATKTKEQSKLRGAIESITKENMQLEKRLLQKVSEIAQLSGSLTQTQNQLATVENEKESLKQQLSLNQQTITSLQEQLIHTQSKTDRLKQLELQMNEQLATAVTQAQTLQSSLHSLETDYFADIEKYNELVTQLQDELLNKQNEIAIIKAENAEVEELTEDQRKVLEMEFEPRFKKLYSDCIFYPEFYKDFAQITTAERLKVEVAINELTYKPEIAQHKMRPNAVKTKYQTILEYPFNTDSAGRIYFNKQDNRIHIYRISRTKNGKGKLTQDNVIEWLKQNK